MSVTVTLDTKGLDALLSHWDEGVAHILDTTANDILHDAQENIHRNNQIRTGKMLNSGQVEPGEDQYSRYIHFTAEYSAYPELGTRYFAGKPYLLPAVEHRRSGLQDNFSAFFGSLVEK